MKVKRMKLTEIVGMKTLRNSDLLSRLTKNYNNFENTVSVRKSRERVDRSQEPWLPLIPESLRGAGEGNHFSICRRISTVRRCYFYEEAGTGVTLVVSRRPQAVGNLIFGRCPRPGRRKCSWKQTSKGLSSMLTGVLSAPEASNLALPPLG